MNPATEDPMLSLVAALPDQLAASEEMLEEVVLPEGMARSRILLCGMGGSAAAGELARGVFAGHPFFFAVNRDYRLPGWVDADTLLIFSSYSGDTEETLSVWEEARHRRPDGPAVVLTSGGSLAEAAREARVPVLILPGGLPPRASLGFGLGCLFRLLGRLGMVEGVEAELNEAIAVLRQGNETLGPAAPASTARRLARRLYGKLLLIYTATGLAEAAALRLKAQVNENAKALAYTATLPELDHNEIVGWEVPSRVRAETFVLALRDRQDHPRVQRRFELTRSILGARVPGWEEHESRGASAVARALSLVQFGDYLSVYLAEAGGVEATPVKAIESLKVRLADQEA
jgi:glucose/mannose-6-phosphate isomerase